MAFDVCDKEMIKTVDELRKMAADGTDAMVSRLGLQAVIASAIVAAMGAAPAAGAPAPAVLITVATHGTDDLWLPPAQITTRMSNAVQAFVQSLIPVGGVDTFWPTVVLSYATGCRGGTDAPGAGPGMYFAAAMVRALAQAGFACFSGLCIPGGVDWKTFLPRLQRKLIKRAAAQVLVVMQTKALYRSTPCLVEIHTALQNGVTVIPVRLELDLPRADEQWSEQGDPQDIKDNMMRAKVQEGLNKLNSVPARGTLLEQLPAELPKIVELVRGAHKPGSLPAEVAAGVVAAGGGAAAVAVKQQHGAAAEENSEEPAADEPVVEASASSGGPAAGAGGAAGCGAPAPAAPAKVPAREKSKFPPMTNERIRDAVKAFVAEGGGKKVADFRHSPKAEAEYGPVTEWDVSEVTCFQQLFEYCAKFNEDISGWQTGKVTSMHCMFYGAAAFNQPIGRWEVGKVTTMQVLLGQVNETA